MCRTEFGKLFYQFRGKCLVTVEGNEKMDWDSGFFMPQNNDSVGEKEPDKKADEEKTVHCAECNELIGAVSITLYEIDKKHYCSGCYSRKIIALAVERDHFDIKQETKR